MSLIRTLENLCHECYACVRNCPVKAVRVNNGQAEVIAERCINCGNCVRICSQGAKEVEDYVQVVRDYLQAGEKVIVGLAPSFPAYIPGVQMEKWSSYLQQMGFYSVYEVAWGAQLMINAYRKILYSTPGQTMISSACPVIVTLIEKYYPTLVPYLLSVTSPMVALCRYIRSVEGPDTKIVLVGPCLAKKRELKEDHINQVVLTYSELLDLGKGLTGVDFMMSNSNQNKLSVSNQNDHPPMAARNIPIAGGLLESLEIDLREKKIDHLKVEGEERVFEFLNSLRNGEIQPGFVDILFCEGCINGVDLIQENYFCKERAVKNFIQKNTHFPDDHACYSTDVTDYLHLTQEFTPDYKELPHPTREEVWEILKQTGKEEESDLLNCGACGYDSCKEKAIAVFQGLAEVEMCLPYLVAEKRREIRRVQELNHELDELLNSSYDGMAVISKEGVVERVNQAYSRMVKLPADQLVGQKISDLEEQKIIYPAVAALGLKEKRNITLIQNTRHGRQILATASPILADDGSIIRVLVNARDTCKLRELENKTAENKRICEYLNQRDERGEGVDEQVVSQSQAMSNIIQLAKKIAPTVSTVLITGESGVGKDVIARYIHQTSRPEKKFVKINCGAIPEALLESELFGYETGAFSGARRQGKPGLIELADRGTLFLDEIGEMPLSLQVKLLQVLQDCRLTRLGGVQEISVDFRLIAATNQDLKKMIEEKKFREDLYYRLNVVPIYIPPLRERREDIIPLTTHFLYQLNRKYAKEIFFSQPGKNVLCEYDWPGNVRELLNCLERLVVTTESNSIAQESILEILDLDQGTPEDLIVKKIIPLSDAIGKVEKQLLNMAKERGNTTYEIGKLLGVNQSTVVRKLKKYFK